MPTSRRSRSWRVARAPPPRSLASSIASMQLARTTMRSRVASPMPRRCSTAVRSSTSTTSGFSRTTASSTRHDCSPRATTLCACTRWPVCSAAFRSARTCGMRRVRRPGRRSAARRCCSTSTDPRTTCSSERSGSSCSHSGPPSSVRTWCTSTPSAARMSSSSTAVRWSWPPTGPWWSGCPNSSRIGSSST